MSSQEPQSFKEAFSQALTTGPNGEKTTLLEQMGGVEGLVTSSLPVLVLIPVNSFFGLMPALAAAVGVSVLTFLWAIVRKKRLQPAVSGLFGVVVAAAIAWWVGSAKGYFLYGIWYSALLALVFVISIALRYPAVGVVWRGLNGHGMAWRKNKKALHSFDLATGAWAVVFGVRFIVQNYLYSSSSTEALGIARLVMGWPLTIVVMIITVWAVRRADHACPPAE